MAYAITLLAALGAFLWATPAHQVIVDNFHAAKNAIVDSTASTSMPFKAQIDSAISTVRAKAMELLRKQLHAAVEETVR
jgi:hypothetical protein